MNKKKKQKKKKNRGGDEKEEWGKWHDDLHPETKQSVWAVVSFGAATLLLLAWFGKAGLAGEGISTFFRLLFGKAFLVAPVALILAGISFLFGMRRHIFGGTFLGAFLFFISVLGLGEIFGGSQTGGYAGFGIAFAPLRFFDRTASMVFFGAILIVSFLLMFNRALVPQRKEKEEEETDETLAVGEKGPQKSFLSRMGGFFSAFGGKKQDNVLVVNAMPESSSQQSPPEDITSPLPQQLTPESPNEDSVAYKPLAPSPSWVGGLVSRRRVSTNYKPPP